LEKSDSPPIILLQSDYGSRVFSDNHPESENGYKLNVPILSAYYLPEVDGLSLYPEVSPVNSFRIIFNTYFGGQLPLLRDESFILVEDNGVLEFIDACSHYRCDGK
jgi:hypothetical protein